MEVNNFELGAESDRPVPVFELTLHFQLIH